jgi:hypothetical protein
VAGFETFAEETFFGAEAFAFGLALVLFELLLGAGLAFALAGVFLVVLGVGII